MPDRSGPEHDDALTGLDPAALHGADRDRHRLGHRRDRGVVDVDREGVVGVDPQQLLQASVDVDPDQLEVVARVAAADAARVAMAARVQRPERDPSADRQPFVAVGTDGGDPGCRLVSLHARELRSPRRRLTARR